uniref:Uncharacterized protein n=1 Tax=Solanum tuberosum TaxID=4113 RepID=M1D8M9_SOLTU
MSFSSPNGLFSSPNVKFSSPTRRLTRQGLRASDVAGMHQASDVGQLQAASAKACTHRTWHMRIGQATSSNDGQHQPRVARIRCGLCTTLSQRREWPTRIALGLHITSTSGVDCLHLPCLAHNGQPTSDVACPHRSWPVNINQPTSDIDWTHLPWTAHNGQPTSAVACTQRSADVGRGLAASPLDCTQQLANVGRGLAASPLDCTQRSADIGRGLPASAVACPTLVEV